LCPSSLVPLLQCCSRIGLRRTSNFFNGVVRRKSGSDFSMGHLQIFKEQRRGIIFIVTNPLSSSSSLVPPMSIHSSFPLWKFLKFERFQFWEYNCVIFLVFGFYSQKLNFHLFQSICSRYLYFNDSRDGSFSKEANTLNMATQRDKAFLI